MAIASAPSSAPQSDAKPTPRDIGRATAAVMHAEDRKDYRGLRL